MSLQTVKNGISLAIKTKKREEELGVRGAAKECGVDASTLSRLENGAYSTLPDAGTLEKLADWLGISVSSLLGGDGNESFKNSTAPEVVRVHLRADKNLTPKTAKALADMFEALYKQATKK